MKKSQPAVLNELVEQGRAVLETLEPERQDSNTAIQQNVNTVKRQDGKDQMVKVTIRMPEELVKQLKHRAIDENRTLQDLLIEVSRNYMEEAQ